MQYTKPITSTAEAIAFFNQLAIEGKGFHPDDSPSSIINSETGEPLFTRNEAEFVARRIDEAFMHLDDVYSVALDAINSVGKA